MVAGVVVAAAAAAAAAATAVTAAATAMLQPAAVVSGWPVAAVADLQRKHGTGIKEVGGRPPLAADIAYPAVTNKPSC